MMERIQVFFVAQNKPAQFIRVAFGIYGGEKKTCRPRGFHKTKIKV